MTELLLIKNIEKSSSLQPRAKMDMAIVDEYTESLKNEASFPPITVFKVGPKYLLVDGYHRLLALQGAGQDKVLADIREGTERDAILFSVGANATHGLRRTNDDKHRAVMVMLKDKEWSQWSNHKVADMCNVSDEFVRQIRNESQAKKKDSPAVSTNVGKIPSEKVKVERGGKTFKMNTTKIGKTSKTAENLPPVTAPAVTPGETALKEKHTEQHPPVTRPPALTGNDNPIRGDTDPERLALANKGAELFLENISPVIKKSVIEYQKKNNNQCRRNWPG